MTEEYEKLGKWEFSCATLYGLEEVGESSKLWAVGVSDGSGREGREVNPPDLCLAQIKGYLVYWSLSVHWLHLSPRLYSNILSSTQQTTRLCLHHKRWTEWELSDKFYCLNISWWLTMWEVRYSPPPTLRVLWGRIWLNNTCVGSRLEGGGGGMEGKAEVSIKQVHLMMF